MAVERRGTSTISFRAYWRNPHTKLIEHGPARETIEEAQADDAMVKFRLKSQPESFTRESAHAVAVPEIVTFRAAADGFLARKDLTEGTVRSALYALRPAVKMLGTIEAEKLTRADLRRYEASFAGDGLKQATIHKRIKLVRMVLGWARSTGLIESHMVDGHTVKKGEVEQDPPPTPEEVRLILGACAPHIRRAVLMTYYLGLRFGPSETLSVRWADFDALNATLTVRCAKNKKTPWRKVCLAPSLLQEMLAWLAEDKVKDRAGGTIVHFNGKAIKTIWVSWYAALKRAGITRHLKPYSLRHTFATEAMAGGSDMKAVASHMGHQDVSMLHNVYQHVLDKQRREVAASIPDVLGAAPSGIQDGIQEGSQMGLGRTHESLVFRQ